MKLSTLEKITICFSKEIMQNIESFYAPIEDKMALMANISQILISTLVYTQINVFNISDDFEDVLDKTLDTIKDFILTNVETQKSRMN